MTAYQTILEDLKAAPKTWLVTGVAGFIGSHLLETLLKLDQRVVALDNFSTGAPKNLASVKALVSAEQWQRFDCREGSVADIGACREVTKGVDYVLHQAGFISVPLSLEDPIGCHDTNVTGTLNLLTASRDHKVRRFVYASSSAVYGDDERMPKVEEQIGKPLSPYGASKLMDEHYAGLFVQHYGLECVGLRYFNVFGTRQNPTGGYAAVIPQWITTLVRGGECQINGDGSATRDFCPVENIVQANILAATSKNPASAGEAYNVALGGSTTLNELYEIISQKLANLGVAPRPARYAPPRPGDIAHSSADISKIRRDLGFEPALTVQEGLDQTVAWYAAERV